MSWFLAAFLVLAAPPQSRNLDALVDGVQNWFARMADFSADFEQISVDELNRKTAESGHLYLKRERMMLWEYKTTHGKKQFISDGKTVFLYVEADRLVRRAPIKDVADGRMPLLFLLGRSNLRDEFTAFRELSEKPQVTGNRVIAMTPRKKGEIDEIRMEVDPANFRVRRVILKGVDGAQSDFVFNNIDDKTKREPRFFEFPIPKGVDVVDGF